MVRVRCSLKPPDSLWRSLLIISQTKTSPPRRQLGGLARPHARALHAHCTSSALLLIGARRAHFGALVSSLTCSRCGQSWRVSHSCVPLVASYCAIPLTHSHACTLARSHSQWADTHVHIHIGTHAGFTQASCLTLLRVKPRQPQRLVRHIYV